jgi:hypothetical protein
MKLWCGGGSIWKNFVREFFQKTESCCTAWGKTGHCCAHCGQKQPIGAQSCCTCMQQGQQVCSQCAPMQQGQAPPSHTCMQLAKHQASATMVGLYNHQGHHHHHHRCQPRKKKFLNFEVKFGMQIKKNERNAGEEESGDLEL